MNNEKDLIKMIDQAFENAVAPADGDVSNGAETLGGYTTPEQFHEETGIRFRMTKAEREQYGTDAAARLAAFRARQDAGSLPTRSASASQG